MRWSGAPSHYLAASTWTNRSQCIETLSQRNLSMLFGRKHPSHDVIFFGQKSPKKNPKVIRLHDVLEPLKQALWASRDMTISSQICRSKLRSSVPLVSKSPLRESRTPRCGSGPNCPLEGPFPNCPLEGPSPNCPLEGRSPEATGGPFPQATALPPPPSLLFLQPLGSFLQCSRKGGLGWPGEAAQWGSSKRLLWSDPHLGVFKRRDRDRDRQRERERERETER